MLKFICGHCSFFNVLSPHPSSVGTLSRATNVAFKGRGQTNTVPHSPARHGSVFNTSLPTMTGDTKSAPPLYSRCNTARQIFRLQITSWMRRPMKNNWPAARCPRGLEDMRCECTVCMVTEMFRRPETNRLKYDIHL